jgi:outer membrane biosynthesis protein TonB
MKKTIFFICVSGLLAPTCLQAQTTTKPAKGYGVSIQQTQPEFPGGADSLQKYLDFNLVFPKDANNARVQGKSYVGFKVGRDGQLSDVRVLNNLYPSVDEEAIRLVKAMPAWKPGSISGKPADMQYILSIDFVLPKNQK